MKHWDWIRIRAGLYVGLVVFAAGMFLYDLYLMIDHLW